MMDARLAPNSPAKPRRHTLFASLKRVLWRAPRWYELLICLWLPLGFWLNHGFSMGVPARFAAIFLIIRSLSVPMHYCENRWPDGERGIEYGARGTVGLVIFYLSLPIFQKLWQDAARNGIDWAGTGSNVLAFIAFGVFMLVLLGPLMWLLDRVFKPLFRRENLKFASALGFISACGAWWLIVIFGAIYSGFGRVMFGGSSQ